MLASGRLPKSSTLLWPKPPTMSARTACLWILSACLLCVPLQAKAQLQPAPSPQSGPVVINPTPPEGFRQVHLAAGGPRTAIITAYVRLPKVKPGAKTPAVVAMHGCGGLFTKKGTFSARHAAWADILTDAGYVVVFPDSFNARGYRQVCTLKSAERPIRPAHRVHDAFAALRWLASEPAADTGRTALLGWSHGGSTLLWAAAKGAEAVKPDIRLAIAFYPGCRIPAGRATWGPRVPLSILIGSADNWTKPAFCRDLVTRYPQIHLQEYEGAVHGFDAPNSPRRTRRDAGLAPDPAVGVEVGTDPKARAAAIAEVLSRLARAFASN